MAGHTAARSAGFTTPASTSTRANMMVHARTTPRASAAASFAWFWLRSAKESVTAVLDARPPTMPVMPTPRFGPTTCTRT